MGPPSDSQWPCLRLRFDALKLASDHKLRPVHSYPPHNLLSARPSQSHIFARSRLQSLPMTRPSPQKPIPPHPSTGYALISAVVTANLHLVRTLLHSIPHQQRRLLANFSGYDKRSSLHHACRDGHLPIVKELFAAGADPHALDRFGATCVKDAINNGRLDVLRFLASVEVQLPGSLATCVNPCYVFGRDLLNLAAVGHVRAARQLVRNFSVNVNYVNADGRSALHIATMRGDKDMVEYLIDAGANANLPDRWGITPRQEALRCARADLLDVMTEQEAVHPTQGLPAMLLEPSNFMCC